MNKKTAGKAKNNDSSSGILFCSGMIAGEGLVGIILAFFAAIGIDTIFDLSGNLNTGLVGGIILMLVMIGCVLKFGLKKTEKGTANEKK